MLNQFRDERSRAGRRVKNFDVLIRQRRAEMLFQQIIRAFDHEFDNFVRRVHDAELVRAFRIIGFVKIFIHDFQKLLFFVMMLNPRRFRFNRVVIIFDAGERVAPRRTREKGVDHQFQFAGDGVFAVKMALAENRIENFRRQNMLNQHLLNIERGDRRIDAVLAQIPEGRMRPLKGRITPRMFADDAAQRVQNIGNVLLELLDRLAERDDFRAFIFDKRRQNPVQAVSVAHVAAQPLRAVLNQHDVARVLEQDIERRIAERQLVGNRRVQVVGGVFAFPIAPIEPVAVFDRPVRAFLRSRETRFVNQRQMFRGAVGFEQIGERPAQRQFVLRPAELRILLDFIVIALDRLF